MRTAARTAGIFVLMLVGCYLAVVAFMPVPASSWATAEPDGGRAAAQLVQQARTLVSRSTSLGGALAGGGAGIGIASDRTSTVDGSATDTTSGH